MPKKIWLSVVASESASNPETLSLATGIDPVVVELKVDPEPEATGVDLELEPHPALAHSSWVVLGSVTGIS